ncbi:MAG: D-aminoacyl-tRNA deacylase [Methanobacteriaceae archaeon]|nr:D-aminoacyl-tRNA deacylase [Methanobacteriaceae archaeon]
MKLVIQRVSEAHVEVENEIVGQIKKGLMVLIGIKEGDTTEEADYLINKLLKMRIFPDEEGKMNKSIQDVDGSLLLISQFTLHSSHKKHRPSFHKAMNFKDAEILYNYFCNKCSEQIHTETGSFGDMMKVQLVNDGPVTIVIEKKF